MHSKLPLPSILEAPILVVHLLLQSVNYTSIIHAERIEVVVTLVAGDRAMARDRIVAPLRQLDGPRLQCRILLVTLSLVSKPPLPLRARRVFHTATDGDFKAPVIQVVDSMCEEPVDPYLLTRVLVLAPGVLSIRVFGTHESEVEIFQAGYIPESIYSDLTWDS
jgi:hypothetical protein